MSQTATLDIAKTSNIYVCGKMSGLKDFNRAAFNQAAASLRAQGLTVFNPGEIIGESDWEWSDYMRTSLKGMLDCDVLYVLTGYESSVGANIEIDLANKLGLLIIYEEKTITA